MDEQSQWCAYFLRKIRKEFYSMQSMLWYEFLIGFVDPEFCRMSKIKIKNADIGSLLEEAETELANFLSNFTHLVLPNDARLWVDGVNHGSGGHVYLTVTSPESETIPVSEVEYDPFSFESIWEKEVLSWVSSQFYLFWHAGYSQYTILLGDASSMARELRRMEFHEYFFREIKDMPEKLRQEYFSTDFSPRVEMEDGVPRIFYHIFSPFGGIYKREACVEPPEEEEAVIPFHCHVCY